MRPVTAWGTFAALLGAAGLALSVPLVVHVLARGDAIVDEPIQSPEAALPVAAAAAACGVLLASGAVGCAPALRQRRWTPLARLGFPLALACAVALAAFWLGTVALALAAAIAAPAALAAAAASLVPPRPTLGSFLARSWASNGGLATLGLVAFGALGALEGAQPMVPWSSVVAALATLLLLAAAVRHAAQERSPLWPRPHEQVRRTHATPAVEEAAGRLHPYIEEGTGRAAYHALVAPLGAALPPAPEPGPPVLPPRLAAWCAGLRSAALAAPLVLLLPDVGPPAALLAFGLALPWTRRALLAPGEPSPPWAWLLGGLAASGALAWGAPAAGLPVELAAAGLPYAAVGLLRLRRRLPEGIASARAGKSAALAAASRRHAVGGGLVALGFALLPALRAAVVPLLGDELPDASLAVVAAGVAGGLLWAASAAATGRWAADSHRGVGQGAHEATARRRAAHRTLLEQAEMM